MTLKIPSLNFLYQSDKELQPVHGQYKLHSVPILPYKNLDTFNPINFVNLKIEFACISIR